MPTRPLYRQQPPSSIVANSVELFTRQFPFDPQAHKEWRQWKDVTEPNYYVIFKVETDKILGRLWRLWVTEGEPLHAGDPPETPKPRILLYVKNSLENPGYRYYNSYDPSEDFRIVTILSTVSLVWEPSPSGVRFTVNDK